MISRVDVGSATTITLADIYISQLRNFKMPTTRQSSNSFSQLDNASNVVRQNSNAAAVLKEENEKLRQRTGDLISKYEDLQHALYCRTETIRDLLVFLRSELADHLGRMPLSSDGEASFNLGAEWDEYRM